ncbi:hypothetical protein T265_09922 [Opisthorchis viverrini]|uniref:Tubulin/FtsZ family, GTPase domain protein n=1 Tax=Opisthorchis viverrini TaxID=6198 RepID=A0A074Z8G0_OPIVI|nr:hypothetical protein T265_09922 [Opisthorchis viverrini]KER21857.1 hypothetical protein T265_09922 [Opisthorchis viverrini]
MAREVILIHIGQAGVQIGSALWELFCIEHRISADGQLNLSGPENQMTAAEHVTSFFYEGQRTFTPRAIMVDLEPTVVDEIRTGPYRQLWKPTSLITGKEDAANNYGRGNCTIGKLKLDETMESIRKLAEDSQNLAAFELVHSNSGGTGSGMTSLIIDHLCDEYGKRFKFSTSIFPSTMYSTSTVDPYNALLHSHATMETLDCDILVDNQTMFERCTKNLSIPQPSYTEINRLLAQMLSSVFLSHRFVYHGSQHADTTELLTNLIPYPRIHFPSLFYAPIVSKTQLNHDALTVTELTRAVFSEDAKTIDFPCRQNAYISCAMLYRGVSSPKHVYDALQYVKGTPSVGASFVDWCPTGFKVGLNSMPPATFLHSPLGETPRSVCMLAGNLGMRQAWQRNNSKFDVLFSRRSFVHWFIGEGIEESEFIEAREDMAYLEQDYAELMSDTWVQVYGTGPQMFDENSVPQLQELQQEYQQPIDEQQYYDEEAISSRASTNQSAALRAHQSNNANTLLSRTMLQQWQQQIRYPKSSDYQLNNDSESAELNDSMSLVEPTSSSQHAVLSSDHSDNVRQEAPNHVSHFNEMGDEWSDTREEPLRPMSGKYDDGLGSNCSQYSERDSIPPYSLHGDSGGLERHVSLVNTSNESGVPTADIARPSGIRDINMNNARHSLASNDTAFLPTEPVIILDCTSRSSYIPDVPYRGNDESGGWSQTAELSSSRETKDTLSPQHSGAPSGSETPSMQRHKSSLKPSDGRRHFPCSSAMAYVGLVESVVREDLNRSKDLDSYTTSSARGSSDLPCLVQYPEPLMLGNEQLRTIKQDSITSGLGSIAHSSNSIYSIQICSIEDSNEDSNNKSTSRDRLQQPYPISEDRVTRESCYHHKHRQHRGKRHTKHHHHRPHPSRHTHHRHHRKPDNTLVVIDNSYKRDIVPEVHLQIGANRPLYTRQHGHHVKHTNSNVSNAIPHKSGKPQLPAGDIVSNDAFSVTEVDITDDGRALTPVLSAWSSCDQPGGTRTAAL